MTYYRYRILKCLLVVILVIAVQSCTTLRKIYATSNNIAIFQGEEEVKAINNGSINLDKKGFSLRFFVMKNPKELTDNTKFNYARVAFFKNKKAFLQAGKEGKDDYHCFMQGMSAATENGTYKSVAVNTAEYDYNGHYALYHKESGGKTANVLSAKNDFLRLEFPITKIKIEDEYVDINNVGVSELYVAFFIDKNYNEQIDSGELTKFTLNFTK